MKHILALTIAFMAGIALLFVADENRGQLQQPSSSLMSESKTIYGNSESRLAGSLSPLAVAANFYPNKAELSNDQDHDGKYDAMADHLAMLALGLLAALSLVFVLRALVCGRLLLACCGSPKLSSVWLQILERSG